jgi:hypothetical protein
MCCAPCSAGATLFFALMQLTEQLLAATNSDDLAAAMHLNQEHLTTTVRASIRPEHGYLSNTSPSSSCDRSHAATKCECLRCW